MTLLLDLDPRLGLERAAQRGELDRFEQQQIEFFERVRSVYLQRAAEEPHRFALIDASKPLDAVKSQVIETMETLCE